MERNLALLRYRVIALLRLIRYRFFLFAGLFPYLLGQAIAFNRIYNPSNPIIQATHFNWQNFWMGFLGIFLVLIGVELFNEYFDAKEGGDRIFAKSQEPKAKSRNMTLCSKPFALSLFPLALCSMLFAFFIGLYLTFQIGWPILLFSFLGFLGAYFYVGPPLRWAYRGLGELVIALCYGPLMVLGSYYLQTKRISFVPFIISLICGLAIFSLAILNEIPDYYQDKLVGKRNLVVRLGKQKSIRLLVLSLVCLYLFLVLNIWINKTTLLMMFPFLLLPWIIKSLAIVTRNYENPKNFISAINANIANYLLIVFSLGTGYLT